MKHKYIFTVHVMILALFFSSCKKYLEEFPNDALSSERAIVDAGSARAAIIGAYDRVQGYQSANYPTLGTITADNVIFNGTLSQYLQLDQNAIPADNVTTVAAYQGIYRAINSANSIIAALPAISDPLLSTEEKDKILGEAYFIRALGYFDLARGWGGVQLQLQPTIDINAAKGITRSTLQQTYDQVLSDIIEAENLLPDDATTRNRAQKSSASALRARLHLYRKEWALAETYASQVIANTKYVLIPVYKNFFTTPFNTTESVFELSYSVNDRNTFWNLWYLSSGGGQYTLKPSVAIINKLNDPATGGTRKTLIAGTGNNIYGVLYNSSATGADPSYVIRIAELYLIRAEARAQQDKLPGALADLNEIRRRAGVPAATASAKPEILLAIENENAVEFAFEAHRWFDLVRTERAGAVLGITDQRFWLFPIPLADVLSDPDVDQNPGY
ncbi:MAG: RagB/SusD family nutrient uptake outer membrane protein [Rhizobacter sp.]|nr:RagB/SusD family nutrient uptake outer membrane protein [Ferruginibacter sp.]